MIFNPVSIMNLVGQLGGDHQQAARQLQGMNQVDSQQHAGMLNGLGLDPRQLESGGYQQHFGAQQLPGFAGYQPGDWAYADQQPRFSTSGQQQGGGQGLGYGQGGGQEQGYREQQARGATAEQRGGREQGC